MKKWIARHGNVEEITISKETKHFYFEEIEGKEFRLSKTATLRQTGYEVYSTKETAVEMLKHHLEEKIDRIKYSLREASMSLNKLKRVNRED